MGIVGLQGQLAGTIGLHQHMVRQCGQCFYGKGGSGQLAIFAGGPQTENPPGGQGLADVLRRRGRQQGVFLKGADMGGGTEEDRPR